MSDVETFESYAEVRRDAVYPFSYVISFWSGGAILRDQFFDTAQQAVDWWNVWGQGSPLHWRIGNVAG
jgi:hypothetical protein